MHRAPISPKTIGSHPSGMYRKGRFRQKPQRKTPALCYHLARLFKAGVNNSSRMETPESAVTKLKGLRVPVGVRDSGRRLFNTRSIYGPVPTVASALSWFSSQSSKAKHKQIAIEPLEYWVKALLKNFLFKFA